MCKQCAPIAEEEESAIRAEHVRTQVANDLFLEENRRMSAKGREVAEKCPDCGAPTLGKKFCPGCGKKLAAAPAFCGDCGAKLSRARSSAGSAARSRPKPDPHGAPGPGWPCLTSPSATV
jgi:hypothetical protein